LYGQLGISYMFLENEGSYWSHPKCLGLPRFFFSKPIFIF
jgi:hypothetical protein